MMLQQIVDLGVIFELMGIKFYLVDFHRIRFQASKHFSRFEYAKMNEIK